MLVMKFGGTSVADAKAMMRIIELIKTHRSPQTIVVVSAIAEATNILTELTALAANNRLLEAHSVLSSFRDRHLKIASNLLKNRNLHEQTKKQIHNYFVEICDTLKSISLSSKMSDKQFAKTLAFGELLSSTILHTALLDNNLRTTLVDARKVIITNDNHRKGTPLIEQMIQRMVPLFNTHLGQGNIVLTQGFIAGTIDGTTTILGREGSDYSASLIGMLMDANEIQIWTDVDGIMTIDPKISNKARFIPYLSFDEAAKLSFFGAKVIHPLTIKPAATKNIPVRILNSKNLSPTQPGTLITGSYTQKHIKKTKESALLAITYKTEQDKALVALIGNNLTNMEEIKFDVFKALDGSTIEMTVSDEANSTLILTVEKDEVLTIIQKLHNMFFE